MCGAARPGIMVALLQRGLRGRGGWEVVPTFQHLGVPGIGHNGSNLRWFSVVWLALSLDAGLMIDVNGGGGSTAMQALDSLMRQRLVASP